MQRMSRRMPRAGRYGDLQGRVSLALLRKENPAANSVDNGPDPPLGAARVLDAGRRKFLLSYAVARKRRATDRRCSPKPFDSQICAPVLQRLAAPKQKSKTRNPKSKIQSGSLARHL